MDIPRKYHPAHELNKDVIQVGEELPIYIPAELLYNDKVQIYLGLSSTVITNVRGGQTISLIDLITFGSGEFRKRFKERLIKTPCSVLLMIIGIGLLKRYKTERPTSGLAVREELQGKEVGFLIQTIINEQARLLKLKELYVTMAQANIASLELHQRCGFKQTGKLVPYFVYRNNAKVVDM